ncbi:unnamed protein product, partial [Prorocentrum cordatum]
MSASHFDGGRKLSEVSVSRSLHLAFCERSCSLCHHACLCQDRISVPPVAPRHASSVLSAMVKKQPKKRAWSKVKVDDVEEAMEDDRNIAKMKRYDRPEALKGKDGGADAAELFTIDTKGSFEGVSATSRREIARAKLFPPKGPNIGLSATEESKVSRAEGSLGAASKRARGSKEPEVFDLWAAPDPATARKQRAQAEEEAAMTVIRRPLTRPSKVPKTLHQKVSAAPPVIPAHEGQSMNPTEEAYEELACTAAARQLEKEAEADALERKLRPITHELRERLGQDAVKDLDDEAQMKLWRSLTGKQSGDQEGAEAGGEDSREHGDAPGKRTRRALGGARSGGKSANGGHSVASVQASHAGSEYPSVVESRDFWTARCQSTLGVFLLQRSSGFTFS